jgi:predicted outer membrane repeat protein
MRRIKFFPIVMVVFLLISAITVQASAEWTVCESGCDFTSIQAGINSANPGDTLLLTSVFYYENVVVHKNINIHGKAPGKTIVHGGENGIVFMIEPGVRTVISNLEIIYGSAPNGSGVYNNGGTVILSKVEVDRNQITAFGAGMVYNDHGKLTLLDSTVGGSDGIGISNFYGQLILERSTIINNAGGIDNFEGAVTVSYSYFAGNTSAAGGGIHNSVVYSGKALVIRNSAFWINSGGFGGAVYSTGRGPIKIFNSTFSENQADARGGGIYTAGALTIANSTFVGNQASIGGAIGTISVKYFRMDNSILAGSVGSTNCSIDYSLVVQGGHNLIDDDSCGFPANPVTNLADLAYNGGLTPTYALLPGSNAIDSGDDAICSSKNIGGVDQRGYPRNDGACDIGAFELQQ